MKKKIALALAAIMTFAAAMPMSLMAVSSNQAANKIVGYDDKTLMPQASLNIPGGSAVLTTGTPPYDFAGTTATGSGTSLGITFNSTTMPMSEQAFWLDLTNAQWAYVARNGLLPTSNTSYSTAGNVTALSYQNGGATADMVNGDYVREIVFPGSATLGAAWGATPTWANLKTDAAGDTFGINDLVPFKIEFYPARNLAQVTYYSGAGITNGAYMNIPLVIRTTKKDDPVSVAISSSSTGSVISETKVDISSTSAGTRSSIDGVNDSAGTKRVGLKTITITESAPGVMKAGTFKVVAPNGYRFVSNIGANGASAYITSGGLTIAANGLALNNPDNTELSITLAGTASTLTSSIIIIQGLIIEPIDDVLEYNKTLAITIKPGNDTKITEQSLDAAKFIKASILYSAADAKALKAGYKNKEAAKVTMEEQTAVSWWAARDTVFTLTDSSGNTLSGVKFSRVEIKYTNLGVAGGTNIYNDGNHNGDRSAGATSAAERAYYNGDGNALTLIGLSVNDTKKGKLEVTAFLSPDVNFEGDVYLMVSGKNYQFTGDDYIQNGGIVKIATVKPTIEVETKSTAVQIGNQRISVADVVISELAGGSISKGKVINLRVGQYGNGTQANIDIIPLKTDTNIVMTGEGKLKVSSSSGAVVVLEVDKVSYDVPFNATITGVQINVDRSVPYGTYELYVSGNGVRDNSKPEVDLTSGPPLGAVSASTMRDGFDNQGIVVNDYIKVATESVNTGFSNKVVVFNNKSADVVINGVPQEMEAPTLNIDDSLYVPLRSIAYAVGAQPSDIVWSDSTKTVAIRLNGSVVTWTLGSSNYMISGTAMGMNNGAKTIIENDRTYIPFRGFAEAFGIPVVWDDAAQSATYNPAVNK